MATMQTGMQAKPIDVIGPGRQIQRFGLNKLSISSACLFIVLTVMRPLVSND